MEETYLGLSVFEDVKAPHGDARRFEQVGHFDINVPVNPGPVFMAMSDWSFGEFSDAVQPCLTVIKTDFNSLHLVATSVIGVASNTVGLTLLDAGHPNALAMSRLCDDRVQILLVACRIGMTEESF